MKIAITSEDTHALWDRYHTAQEAKARWVAEERFAKAQLLSHLGYDAPEKASAEVLFDGKPIGEVKVGERRTLDTRLLRAKYPDIYAECERLTHPISIRAVE